MTHQKRLSAPSSWPIERKSYVFTVSPQAGPHGEEGVPLVVLLRDVVEYVENAKEARYALENDSVVINGEPADDIRTPIGMFDIVAFPEMDEYYRVFPGEGGRLSLTSIDEDAATTKLAKITDKTQIKGGETQLNLHNGDNLLVEDDVYSTDDSVVVDVETDEIVDHFVFDEGRAVTAVDGKHSGEVGKLVEIRITEGSSPNTIVAERDDGTTFETVEEYVFVIGESLTSLEEQEADE